nr:aldo/keto reductase [Halomicroarcula marina]
MVAMTGTGQAARGSLPWLAGVCSQTRQTAFPWGEIAHAGLSVEKVEWAMKAIEYDVIESVQSIFNPFRQRPAEHFFERAVAEDVGIIVRVPLASGLPTDAFDGVEDFDPDDYRRTAAEEGVTAGVGGEGGETVAGVPFEAGLDAVADLRRLVCRRRYDGAVHPPVDPRFRGCDDRHPRLHDA